MQGGENVKKLLMILMLTFIAFGLTGAASAQLVDISNITASIPILSPSQHQAQAEAQLQIVKSTNTNKNTLKNINVNVVKNTNIFKPVNVIKNKNTIGAITVTSINLNSQGFGFC